MIEKCKTVILTFILLVDMRAFHTIFAPRGETADAANVNSQVDPIVLAIVVISNLLLLLVVLPHIRKIVWILARNTLIVAIVTLVVLSVTWSVDSAFSLRRVALFVASTTTAVYLGQVYDVDEIQRMFRNTIIVMLLVSALLFIVVPDFVLDPSTPGALRGLVGHKNNFGLYVGLLAVMFLTGGLGALRHSGLRYLVYIATIALLFLSHSSTALISFAVVAVSFLLLKILQHRPALIWPKVAMGAILAVPLAITFTGGLDPVLGSSVGKDSTLSGRTKLWSLLVDAVAQKPIQGYGYDAYLGSQGPEWDYTTKQVHWLPAHAHNGYIQIALSVGLAGLGMFVALLVKNCSMAWGFACANYGAGSLFPLCVLIYLVVHNITETTFLESSGLVNILFFALYVSMSLYPDVASAQSNVDGEETNPRYVFPTALPNPTVAPSSSH